MNYDELYSSIIAKRSFLCVGLDSDLEQIPLFLRDKEYPIFEFNKAIIDATIDYCVAYKPNLAFYEAEGSLGLRQLEMTVDYIRKKDPSLFIIADAKRGDIGNTAERYAKAFFEKMDFDAVTISPYMGADSVKPFLKHSGKWAIILALTSNASAEDFETSNYTANGTPLYKRVILKSVEWGTPDNIMFVIGATRAERLSEIRRYCPDHIFLVPGVGAQGGTISEVAKHGMNDRCGLLINISRSIIFASKGEDFAEQAGIRAKEAATEMATYL